MKIKILNLKSLFLILLTLGIFGVAKSTWATTITSGGTGCTGNTCCTASNVQAAFNQAQDGDIVYIPSGNCTWNSQVTLDQTKSVSIQGATICTGDHTTSLTCTDNTNITLAYNNSPNGNQPTLIINTISGKSLRVTGITFLDGTNTEQNTGQIAVTGLSDSFRLDHCDFPSTNHQHTKAYFDDVYGVVDHNVFNLPPDPSNGVRIFDSNRDYTGGNDHQGQGDGDGVWASDTGFGSENFLFFEDNIFTNGIVDDCYSGGKLVFRYNTFINNGLQTHPTAHSFANDRGCRAQEVYHNVFTGATSKFCAVDSSSGTALFWENHGSWSGGNITGYANFGTLHNKRRVYNGNTYPQEPTPNGWGYCGTTSSDSSSQTASNWDGNVDPVNGYPCLDQPGRGKGDLLIGKLLVSPWDNRNTINGTTGCSPGTWPDESKACTYPRQALEPIYEWLNTYTGGSFMSVYEDQIIPNRDYYLHTVSFNGTSGVGSGLLSARPSTCTTGSEAGGGVAYWATDTLTLYKCTATNTWTDYYTPYTYPHPLTLSGDLTPPAKPTGLSVS